MKQYTSFRLSIAIAALIFTSCNNEQATVSSDISIPVRVEAIELNSIQQVVTANGTVEPASEVELLTEADGEYQLMKNPRTGKPFILGDRVKKGEVIVKLTNPEYINDIRIETKKLNLDIAKSDYEKQQALFEKGGVTQSEMQNSEVTYISAKYDYEAAQMQLSYLEVNAPFSGIIVTLPYYTQTVELTSGTSVATVMSYDQLKLNVEFPEKYLPTIEKGMEAVVTNYNLKEDTLIGNINQISPVIDEETRTFSGVLDVENGSLAFRPGMYVKADIVTEKKDSTIVIERDLLKKARRGGGYVVYVVERNTAASEKRVITGIESDDMVEIRKGLEIGDQLVVEGYEMLSNRSKVKVLR